MRESMRNEVPPEWAERRTKGLCPVCGKDKTQFEKGLRAFCSQDHRTQYNNCFTTWSELRKKILKRDNHTCQSCGFQDYNRDMDRQLRKDFEMKKLKKWLENPENKKILQTMREKRIIELDEQYSENYKEIMDDWGLIHRSRGSYNEEFHDICLNLKLTPQEEREALPELQIDHIQAITNGGAMWDEKNLRTLCANCHLKKTKKDLDKIANAQGQKRL